MVALELDEGIEAELAQRHTLAGVLPAGPGEVLCSRSASIFASVLGRQSENDIPGSGSQLC